MQGGESPAFFCAANRCGWCHTRDMANLREAKAFVERWKDKGDEKQETQRFWIELLDKVLEDRDYDKHILFEVVADKVEGGSNFKDAVINRGTSHAVLIEQKSSSLKLDKSEPRFGRLVTPFEQAKHYDDLSAVGDKAHWIITCNFKEFWIYDMEKTGRDLYTPAAVITLEDLPSKLHWLDTLIVHPEKKTGFIDEVAVSTEAGRLVGVMYDALRKRYADPDSPETAKSLNRLCVRLVFCLYAEDAGLFDKSNRKIFYDYLAQYDAKGMRKALIALFRVLNQRIEERDKYLADDDPLLASFPYVNGGLFDGDVEVPPFDDEIRDVLLNQASIGFDWSLISPTIFGAVFESTLNDETRRAGGMHYTSIENIHKVIDPLFLDDLTAELDEILKGKQANVKNRKLIEFQKKIAGLRFLDPAAGSGNFLTESYLSLRRLENRCLKERIGYRMMSLGFDEAGLQDVKVSIQQFYGIEINDFAVSVAKTALWIAEAQMYEKTQEILSGDKDFLPLHEYDNIKEGDALRMDWTDVVPASELTYIMGNPPFVGASNMTASQKSEAVSIFGNRHLSNSIDYVGAWYYKALEMMKINKSIKGALVSTNSLTQGEQVYPMWDPLIREGLNIDFAYKTFRWDSEAAEKAHVHCVIIGFSVANSNAKKALYEGDDVTYCDCISPYLICGESILVESRGKPIASVPKMTKGNQPTDGGNFILTEDEKNTLIKNDPSVAPLVHRYVGAKDYLTGKNYRYCLWLKDVDPTEYCRNKEIMRRLDNIRDFRLKSSAKPTRDSANTPYKFFSTPQTNSAYLIIPRHSSENRKYIPIGFMDPDIIASDSCAIVCDATYYMFGVLTSCVHMAWMRAVAGRLEMRYRYSGSMVYNTFPWPTPDDKQRESIALAAQEILKAREKYVKASLADMYGEHMYLYPDLLKAHEANDKAVMEAYGFKKGISESEIVAELMKMYQKMTEQ